MIKYLHFNNTERLKRMSKTEQRRNRSSTIAVEPAKYLDFTTALSTASITMNSIDLNIGIAHVHPEDNYTKRIGREIALSKMSLVQVNIRTIFIDKTHIQLHLEEFEGLDLILRYNKQTGHSTVIR